ncbi:MAG: hypothetical protein MJ252_29490 [archaeon]|nr:hypothetical protein [archaeon]
MFFIDGFYFTKSLPKKKHSAEEEEHRCFYIVYFNKIKKFASLPIYYLMSLALGMTAYVMLVYDNYINAYAMDQFPLESEYDVQILHYVIYIASALFGFFVYCIIDGVLAAYKKRDTIKTCLVLTGIAYFFIFISVIVSSLSYFVVCFIFSHICIYAMLPYYFGICLFSLPEELREDAIVICFMFINLMRSLAMSGFLELQKNIFGIKAMMIINTNFFLFGTVAVGFTFHYIFNIDEEEVSEDSSDSGSGGADDLMLVEDSFLDIGGGYH